MNHAEINRNWSPIGGESTGTMDTEVERHARALDRRICVAPMMDYTGKTAFPRKPNYLQPAAERLSPLCRLPLLSVSALVAGSAPQVDCSQFGSALASRDAGHRQTYVARILAKRCAVR